MRSMIAFIVLMSVSLAYFAPAMIAQRRMKQEAAKVFLLNLFFGWTVTGWLGALSWAMSSRETDLRSAENAARWLRSVRASQRGRGPRC
jgi:hypothetical protein